MRQSKKWLSPRVVAEYCRVNPITVRRWIKDGKLSAIKLPSGRYRVGIADFSDFLKRYSMPTKEELFESEFEKKGEKINGSQD